MALLMMIASDLSAAETESLRLSKLGRLSWSAFECAYYARYSELENAGSFVRLGVNVGREFVDALRDGKITEEDVSQNTPIGFLWSLSPVGTDFSLGIAYAAATDEATKKINNGADDLLGDARDDLIKLNAYNLYRSANCDLLNAPE